MAKNIFRQKFSILGGVTGIPPPVAIPGYAQHVYELWKNNAF